MHQMIHREARKLIYLLPPMWMELATTINGLVHGVRAIRRRLWRWSAT
jgi:hypothetical protein